MKDTETFHTTMISLRRQGEFDKTVSLTWNRLDNEYIIQCDAGRPCRPVYQEGTKLDLIKRQKGWKDIQQHIWIIWTLKNLNVFVLVWNHSIPNDYPRFMGVAYSLLQEA
jgi:hypothetical protein